VKPPPGIHNEPLWIKNCTKIRARAIDFMEGRLDIFAAARMFNLFATWTRAEDDPDLSIFRRIDNDIGSLPVGEVRALWAHHALAKEDAKIHAIREKWMEAAFAAALRLRERYAWSLEARAALRKAGGSSRIV
jgi:hypothetical protein